MERKIVPNVVKPQLVRRLPPDATVRQAAQTMAEHRIGALVVVTPDEKLTHIFTERDLLIRVVAEGLDPDATRLADVATPNPDSLAPDAEARAALDLMRKRRYRHLPIVEDGQIVAIVSIRDLHEVVLSMLEDDVRDRDAMIYGSQDGLA
ncbi:MAG: CBS domain-containing protein [Pseudomonadota bacterium]